MLHLCLSLPSALTDACSLAREGERQSYQGAIFTKNFDGVWVVKSDIIYQERTVIMIDSTKVGHNMRIKKKIYRKMEGGNKQGKPITTNEEDKKI